MRKIISCLSIFLFLMLLASTSLAQKTPDFAWLDEYIQNAVQTFDVPGFVIGIIKDDTVVFKKGYGVRSVERKEPVDSETLFGIASCSKAFTAACIGMLVDEGILQWEDKVIDYVPWFRLHDPYATRELTIGDLLCHRSGLATFDGDLLWYGTDYSSEEVVRRIRELPLKNSFRSKYGYQNIMFITAGEVIKAVTGKTWGDFVRERIFEPLGMEHSTTSNTKFSPEQNIAIPHLNRVEQPFINYDNCGPAAAVNSCVDDLLKWVRMWLDLGKVGDRQILSARSVRTITASQMFLNGGPGTQPMGTHFRNYGYGWALFDYSGRKVIRHDGGLPGFLSRVVFIPEEKLGMVMMVNDMKSLYDPIMKKVFDLYLNDRDVDYVTQAFKAYQRYEKIRADQQKKRKNSRIENTQPSIELREYAGEYQDKMYGKAAVIAESGELTLTLLPTRKLFTGKLEHFHFDTFKVEFKDPFLPFGLVTFHFNAKGEIDHFTIDLPNPDFHFYNLKFER